MSDLRPSSQARRNGFALSELMVTMAISSVLLLTLAALITHTTDGYAQSQRSVNHLSQARAFFQLFESELSIRLPETPIIHSPSSPGGLESSDQITFVRTLHKDEQFPDTPGDLATSCYYVAFVTDSDHQVIPKLFRKILNPTETQTLMEAGDGAVFPEVDPYDDESVIDSVLSFHATPMYQNPVTGNDEPWNQTIAHPPSYIELSIRMTDESLSRRIPDQAGWIRLANFPNKNERPLIRTFSHRISIGK